MSLVVDATMTMAWLLDDECSNGALDVLHQVEVEGAVVPSLWRLEVANVLRNAVRRQHCDEAFVDHSLRRLKRLSITVDSETDSQAWGSTLALAREDRLTLYDAAYLEIAARRHVPLASYDQDLLAAAKRRGLVTISPTP